MVTRAAVSAAFLLLLSIGLTEAQVATAQAGAAGGASPESVQLIIRPRVGDTLHLQMEQLVEVRERRSGSTSDQGSSARSPYGPRRGSTGRASASRATRLRLFAHSLVISSDLSETTLLATSDSMAIWIGTPEDLGEASWQPMNDELRHIRVRVMPDGSMRTGSASSGGAILGPALSAIPGLLPASSVAVGSEWVREISLPSLPVGGIRAEGAVQVRLRLDSLTAGGREAWVSLSGDLKRNDVARDWSPGVRIVTEGTIRGHMLFDRQRAWITSALTELHVVSEFVATSAASNAPRLLDMHIVQQVRVR